MIVATIFIVAILAFLIWGTFSGRMLTELTGHTVYLDRYKISAQTFFDAVQKEVEDRQLPVKMFIKSMFENGIFSGKREYLQIIYLHNAINISSGFFGDGSYVSWNLFFREPTRFNAIPQLKFLTSLRGKNPDMQSNFQADTMASFQAIIRTIVEDQIEVFTAANGVRHFMAEASTPALKYKKQPAING